MNLFKLSKFIETLEPGDDVQILCSEPGKVQILLHGEYHSSITVEPGHILVKSQV